MLKRTTGRLMPGWLEATCPHCGKLLFAMAGPASGRRTADCCVPAHREGFVVELEAEQAEQAEAA